MELNQFRDVDVVIDKINDNFIQRQFVSQGDKDGRTFTVQVTDGGVIGEIPGLTLNLRWRNESSGLPDLSAFSVEDKSNSIFKIEYPQHMMTPGTVIAYIQVLYDGKVMHTKPFEIVVQSLAGEMRGITRQAEYSTLVATLADANKFRTDIDKKVDRNGNEQITVPMLSKSVLKMIDDSVSEINVNTSMIADRAVSYATTNFLKPGDNLFDKSAIVLGSYVLPNGNIVQNASYFYYELRGLTQGQTLNWAGSNGAGRVARYITAYDDNGNVVLGAGREQTIDTDNESIPFTIPNGVKRLIFSFPTAYIANGLDLVIAYATTKPTYKKFEIEFEEKIRLNKYQVNQISESLNIQDFTGKTLTAFGTSITYGHATGISYVDLICDTLGMTMVKKAANGAKLVDILNQITTYDGALPDVIIFDAGANDNTGTPDQLNIGSMTANYTSTLDTATIYGASESILKTLQQKFPGVPIIFVNVQKLYTRNITTQELVSKALIDCQKKWGAKLVDLYHDSTFNTFIPEIRAKYTYDTLNDLENGNGTHPNVAGYTKFYVPPIIKALQAVIGV